MICNSCGHFTREGNYCESCGAKLFVLKSADTSRDALHLWKICLVYGVLLIYLLTDLFLVKDADEGTRSLMEWAFYSIIAVFALIFWKDWLYLLKPKKLNLKRLLIMEAGLVALAFLVNFIANHLNLLLETEEVDYYLPYAAGPLPLLMALFHTAVLPAIFEEICFRGFVFTHTNQFMGLKASIAVTSFLFFFLHLSIISVVWLFGIGLLFGYFRARHRTLWYGIIGHFTYNGVILLINYFSSYF